MTPYINRFPGNRNSLDWLCRKWGRWRSLGGGETRKPWGQAVHPIFYISIKKNPISLKKDCKISERRAWAEFKDFKNTLFYYRRKSLPPLFAGVIRCIVVWFNDTKPLSMVKTLQHQKVAHLSDASATACHLSSVKTSTLAFLPHQGKQMSSEPLRSRTLKWEFPSKLRYLWLPSIVLPLSNHFHTKGAKPKLFSCQQQQLPWQHTGRSALWAQDASVKKEQ